MAAFFILPLDSGMWNGRSLRGNHWICNLRKSSDIALYYKRDAAPSLPPTRIPQYSEDFAYFRIWKYSRAKSHGSSDTRVISSTGVRPRSRVRLSNTFRSLESICINKSSIINSVRWTYRWNSLLSVTFFIWEIEELNVVTLLMGYVLNMCILLLYQRPIQITQFLR